MANTGKTIFDFQQAFSMLLQGESLSATQMQDIMSFLVSGEALDSQIAGLLVALRMKGESVDEIKGAVQHLRDTMVPVNVATNNAIDIVGTGGDGANLFNVSTASSFIAAAAGATVAKHGNRSVSSNSGAADLLMAMGVKLDINAEQTARCIDELGIGFMFAPQHHGALRHVMNARRQLGIRTLFNLLGPLCNPASVKRQLLGVYDRQWLLPVAQVLKGLGSEHVMVVHSEDGLDEISIAAPTDVAELKGGEIYQYQLSPQDFGLQTHDLNQLIVEDAKQSLQMVKAGLKQQNEAATDMLSINAGAAIYLSGLASSMAQGVAQAQDCIGSKLPLEKIAALAQLTQLMSQEDHQTENKD